MKKPELISKVAFPLKKVIKKATFATCGSKIEPIQCTKTVLRWVLIYLLLLIAIAGCSSLATPHLHFNTQDFGTTGSDIGYAVAALPTDSGAIVVGGTEGSLDGINQGLNDAFVRQYDGGVIWSNQFGTRADDRATDLALGSNGTRFVLGETSGALGFKLGNQDIFLRKYSSTGVLNWTRQFGSTGVDSAKDVIVAGNFIYTLSQEQRLFGFTIRKWNASGQLLLTIPNNIKNVRSGEALAVDTLGNLHVAVNYYLGGPSIVKLFSYTPTGTLLSPQPIIFRPGITASTSDMIIDNSNNLYFASYNAGRDASTGGELRKVTTLGVTLWNRRIGPTYWVFPTSLSLDNNGNIYVVGNINNTAFPGFTNSGSSDSFVRQYSPTGTPLWTFQTGGNNSDIALGVAISDAVYVTGKSNSNPNLLGDPNYGGDDAFLIRLDKTTGALLGIDQ